MTFVAELGCAGEVLVEEELVESHVREDVLAIPVGGVVGVHGHGAIAESLELTGEVLAQGPGCRS